MGRDCLHNCFVSLLGLWMLFVTADYIDEVFGGKSLWPTDPYHKALGKLLLTEFGNKVC